MEVVGKGSPSLPHTNIENNAAKQRIYENCGGPGEPHRCGHIVFLVWGWVGGLFIDFIYIYIYRERERERLSLFDFSLRGSLLIDTL